ncbi:baseplate J/gp47 family protein [Metabacillus fastidiosus]|uniref:baseplate J/gp47 family protein n=1 Tax=Metabacillus fastidiosus TaxID=1458 RepID=UPI002E2402B2|nr:baseplate J/gp47 family protein [Metabacillus fastidiosus]
MGLNKDGFTKKTYADIINEMEAKAKELFGENINTRSYTPLGIILRIVAWFLAGLWDGLEKVYNSRFIKKAEGVSLDYHGGNQNLPRNPADYSYVRLAFTGKPNYVIGIEERFNTKSGIYFMLIESVTLDVSGNGSGEAVSVETGRLNDVAANTIVEQAEPIEEIYTVINPEPSRGGADREEDHMYKQRLLQSNEGSGKSTPNAIITALLNTPSVRAVNVIFNNTNEIDVDGNPPKSVHAYVLGGTKENIAASLLDSVAGGIETVGQQQVVVQDLSGEDHLFRFDYAEVLQIYVRLAITPNSNFNVNDIEQIKSNIIKKIGGVDIDGTIQNGLKMGEDVILSQLYGIAYQVNGIEDVTIEIGTSKESLSTTNIIISQPQIVETNVSLIEVILHA